MTELVHVNLSDLQRDENQPRIVFEPVALQELADSIKAVGVVQAISIRQSPDSDDPVPYMIIAGERRWRASKLAGLDVIPCILHDQGISSETIKVQQLTENLFREELNPVEKAEFIQARIDALAEAGVKNATTIVAQELGVSSSWVSKNVAVLRLAEDIKNLALEGKIRDYSILKKLNKLRGDRRKQALSELANEEFVAKDFFKRKRDRKHREKAVEDKQPPSPAVAAVKKKKYALTQEELILIIEKTDFVHVLNSSDLDWRTDDAVFKQCLDKFKDWTLAG